MEFSRQKYWSGLPFPSPGDCPNPGIKPGSPALQTDSLTVRATREAHIYVCVYLLTQRLNTFREHIYLCYIETMLCKRCLLLGREAMTNLEGMLKAETLFC